MQKAFLDQRWPWLLAAAMLLLTLFFSTFGVRVGSNRSGRPPGSVDDIARLAERDDLNVLFILLDTLRAERLGSYGYERDTSPNLDRLVSGGVRFDRHLSQSSWTKASMASLWTALYPTRTGVTRFDHVLPAAANLPAETLKQAGFRTAGIWRNGWVAPTFGFEQGFQVYTRPAARPLPPQVRLENPTLSSSGTDEDAVAAALEFLRIYGDDPWFLYLHLMDVHQYLYDEASALFGGSYSDIYDNSIRWQDGVLGVLFAHLDDLGLSEKTLIAIASDHGEAFRERGPEGHARQVYRETTEVPFLLVFPFRLEPGVVVEARTRNLDIWPTLFDILGLEALSGVDGRSLLPAILAAARGEPSPAEEPVAISHLDQTWGKRDKRPRPTVAVAEGSLRYVRTQAPRTGRVERLFDAADDPRELENRAEQDPATVERLRAVADAYLEATPPWGETPRRELGELELNQLRALGYAIP